MKEKPAVEVRLDKWLWAARFYKTRALAREMIEGGKVHYNGQRSKPSKIVELNATLTLRQGNDERTVIVKAITEQRRPASEAALLYEETAESVEKREKMALCNSQTTSLSIAALKRNLPEHLGFHSRSRARGRQPTPANGAQSPYITASPLNAQPMAP